MDLKTPKWFERNGIVYVSLTSDGTSGSDWIKRLEAKGLKIDRSLKEDLEADSFKPTSGIERIVAIVRGIHFNDDDHPSPLEAFRAKDTEIFDFDISQNYKVLTLGLQTICLLLDRWSADDLQEMLFDSLYLSPTQAEN